MKSAATLFSSNVLIEILEHSKEALNINVPQGTANLQFVKSKCFRFLHKQEVIMDVKVCFPPVVHEHLLTHLKAPLCFYLAFGGEGYRNTIKMCSYS